MGARDGAGHLPAGREPLDLRARGPGDDRKGRQVPPAVPVREPPRGVRDGRRGREAGVPVPGDRARLRGVQARVRDRVQGSPREHRDHEGVPDRGQHEPAVRLDAERRHPNRQAQRRARVERPPERPGRGHAGVPRREARRRRPLHRRGGAREGQDPRSPGRHGLGPDRRHPERLAPPAPRAPPPRARPVHPVAPAVGGEGPRGAQGRAPTRAAERGHAGGERHTHHLRRRGGAPVEDACPAPVPPFPARGRGAETPGAAVVPGGRDRRRRPQELEGPVRRGLHRGRPGPRRAAVPQHPRRGGGRDRDEPREGPRRPRGDPVAPHGPAGGRHLAVAGRVAAVLAPEAAAVHPGDGDRLALPVPPHAVRVVRVRHRIRGVPPRPSPADAPGALPLAPAGPAPAQRREALRGHPGVRAPPLAGHGSPGRARQAGRRQAGRRRPVGPGRDSQARGGGHRSFLVQRAAQERREPRRLGRHPPGRVPRPGRDRPLRDRVDLGLGLRQRQRADCGRRGGHEVRRRPLRPLGELRRRRVARVERRLRPPPSPAAAAPPRPGGQSGAARRPRAAGARRAARLLHPEEPGRVRLQARGMGEGPERLLPDAGGPRVARYHVRRQQPWLWLRGRAAANRRGQRRRRGRELRRGSRVPPSRRAGLHLPRGRGRVRRGVREG
mmetsp:Transcript_23611/g.57182  ORF Transcript_23611/g.57182 Transcript_23611/m.57182 type:complete len:669 (-) Transcript_23611:5465-7471(-)